MCTRWWKLTRSVHSTPLFSVFAVPGTSPDALGGWIVETGGVRFLNYSFRSGCLEIQTATLISVDREKNMARPGTRRGTVNESWKWVPPRPLWIHTHTHLVCSWWWAYPGPKEHALFNTWDDVRPSLWGAVAMFFLLSAPFSFQVEWVQVYSLCFVERSNPKAGRQSHCLDFHL